MVTSLIYNPESSHYDYSEYPTPWKKSYPPPLKDTIKCIHCGADTGIGNILLMVIPPKGLKCPSCGQVVVLTNQVFL